MRFKPWINHEILDQVKERDKLLKHFIKEKNDVLKLDIKNRYKLLRNRVTPMMRVSKSKYFEDYFDKNKRKMGEIWKGMKSLVNIKPFHISSYKLIDDNNNMISNLKEVANIFNNYFVNSGSNKREKKSL